MVEYITLLELKVNVTVDRFVLFLLFYFLLFCCKGYEKYNISFVNYSYLDWSHVHYYQCLNLQMKFKYLESITVYLFKIFEKIQYLLSCHMF